MVVVFFFTIFGFFSSFAEKAFGAGERRLERDGRPSVEVWWPTVWVRFRTLFSFLLERAGRAGGPPPLPSASLSPRRRPSMETLLARPFRTSSSSPISSSSCSDPVLLLPLCRLTVYCSFLASCFFARLPPCRYATRCLPPLW